MRKGLLVFICLFGFSLTYNPAKASHIVGGDIFYQCLGNNQYLITMKVYRDCYNGIPPLDNPAYIGIFNASGSLVQNPAVFLVTDSIIPNETNNPCILFPPNICVEEGTYQFTVTLPPSEGGYTISYQRCCRNYTIANLISPDNTGTTITAHIPDEDLAECNSSPYFNNYPPTVICANFPLEFDHGATDPDGDSLVYSICPPFHGADAINAQPVVPAPPPYANVTFAPPYSASDPLGTVPPIAIDPNTGFITVTPDAVGQYVVGICVTEYRDGVLLATYLRDFQFNVTQCELAVVADIPSLINNCSSYTIDFENNSSGGTVYHWDFGVTGVSNDTSNQFEPTYTYADTGKYIVTLYVNPGTICGDTVTAEVYIYPTFTADIIAPDGCENLPVQFQDQSTANFGVVNTWNWNFGDGGTSTQQNPSYIFDDPGTYNVQLIAMTDLGCADTIIQSVTIQPSPTTNVTPADTTICYLDQIQLVATGTGTFSWTPNYEISNTAISNPVVGPDVTTTYIVKLTNSFGCYGMDSAVIHVITDVFVDAGPDTVLCPGESIQLNGQADGSYLWTPAGSLSDDNISNPVATPLGTTTYVLTSNFGSCFGSDDVTIEVKPFPNIAAGPDATICEGDSVQLEACCGTFFAWVPTASLSNSNIADPFAFPSTTTTYTLTATDTNACNLIVNDEVTVNVITKPDLTLHPDTAIILGTSVDLYANGGVSCQWFPTIGLNDPNSCTPNAQPAEKTTYYVWITTAQGCVYLDSVVVDIILDPLVIVPNAFSPNQDGTNDYFRPVVLGLANFYFRVFNRWGEVVFEAANVNVTGGPVSNSDSWDGSYKGKEQPVGVYVYVVNGVATATGEIIERSGNVTLVR